MTDSTPRFVVAALLVLSTAIFLRAHNHNEVFPPRVALQSFPERLGAWTGTDVPMPKNILEILGPGDFLLRVYQNQERPQPDVDLFIAYFQSQRAGDTIHSPQHCLPGAGWAPVEKKRITLTMPGHESFPANRYLIAKGDSRQIVLYWYWAHDRGVASEYWAKFYLVADSIKMNRSDGALVRVTTAIQPSETVDAVQQRLLSFVGGILPLLDDYIPR